MNRTDGLFWGLMLAVCFFSWFNHQGIILSDEYLYSVEAYKITEGTFELSGSAFHNRFGQLLPMALFVKYLGGNAHVLSLWSLLAFLLLLAGTYFTLRKYDSNLALLITALLGLNPDLLRFSADVSHDLVMSSFGGLALLLLWRQQAEGGRSGIWFACLLFFAFLTKMAILYLFPFLLWVVWQNWRQGEHPHFWIQAVVSGLLLGLAYLTAYGYWTGDPFFRWQGINAEHNISPYSYYQKPWRDILVRVTIGPPAFLLRGAGFAWLLVLAGLYLPSYCWRDLKSPFSFFMSAGIFLLVLHVWGSTSFFSYNPIVLHERMWLLLILPFTVVVGGVLRKGIPSGKWVPFYFGLALASQVILFYYFGDRFPLIYMSGLLFSLALVRVRPFWVVVLICLGAGQLFQISRYQQTSAFFYEQDFLRGLPTDRKTIILTDSILIDKPLVHFRFEPNDSIQWLDWNQVAEGCKPDYLLYNYRRAGILADYFGRPVPEWVPQLSGNDVVNNQFVRICRIQD